MQAYLQDREKQLELMKLCAVALASCMQCSHLAEEHKDACAKVRNPRFLNLLGDLFRTVDLAARCWRPACNFFQRG